MQTNGITNNRISGYSADHLRKVANDFESLFSSMMLRAMRKTVGENSLIPIGMGEKIYTEMLDDEYAKMMSTSSTLGLSDLIVKELQRHENQNSLNQLNNLKAKNFSMIDNRFIGTGQLNHQNSTGSLSRIQKWDSLIKETAERYGVDSNLVVAVVARESGGDPYAVSKAGAKGLMQLMDDTAREMGVKHPFSPWENIDGGVKYLKKMLDQFGGDERLALASYNAGPSVVKRYNGIPPYPETINYVDSVISLKQQLSQKE